MAIKGLKAIHIKPERIITPQCSTVIPANSHFEAWRKDRYKKLRPDMDPERCQRESTVKIDGKPYCSNHAGKIALKLWLSGKLKEA